MELKRLIPFVATMISITAAMHYYLWLKLFKLPGWPHWTRTLGGGLMTLCALWLFTTMATQRTLPPSSHRLLAWPAFIWLGCVFFLMLCFISSDIVLAIVSRILRGIGSGHDLFSPDRRLVLHRAIAVAGAGSAALLGGWSLRRGTSPLVIHEVQITLDKLPPALDGFTIAQVTDIHVGSTIGRDLIEELVTKINTLQADIVAITGDLVDGSVKNLMPVLEPLRLLSSRFGSYFVTGNHEYYSGVGPWVAAIGTLGIRVLRNERVSVGEGGAIDLVGIEDFNATSFGNLSAHITGPDLPGALLGRDASKPAILLAHQPRAILEAARLGIDLQLSGHTHGGQLWPWSYMVKLQQPYVEGHYWHEKSQLYVSPGTGFWGPPMRLGTRAEITKIVLRSPSCLKQ